MATRSPWRMHANQVIKEVVMANKGLEEKDLRKKISAAYPFGERAMHPYKIWLSAVNEYFGKGKKRKNIEADNKQGMLF